MLAQQLYWWISSHCDEEIALKKFSQKREEGTFHNLFLGQHYLDNKIKDATRKLETKDLHEHICKTLKILSDRLSWYTYS